MWRYLYPKFLQLTLAFAVTVLGGCSFSDFNLFFDDTSEICTSGNELEKASCLTREYRSLCANGIFALRTNLRKQRALLDNETGTRICHNKIAVTLGPQINNYNISGTLEEQATEKETVCFDKTDMEKIICIAKVKIDFLRTQFTAACLSKARQYVKNDIMLEAIKLRDEITDSTTIENNRIYKTGGTWFCRKNIKVLGMANPILKSIYADPENKTVQLLFMQAKVECAESSQNLDCVLPKTIKNLGTKFTATCRNQTDATLKEKTLGDIVHARNFIAMLHPGYFEKANFVWLCSETKVYVNGKVILSAQQKKRADRAETKSASHINGLSIEPKKRKKTARWRNRNTRVKRIKSRHKLRTKKANGRAANRSAKQRKEPQRQNDLPEFEILSF